MANIIGIDLAGSVKCDTGICILEKNLAEARIVHFDQEILTLITKVLPKVVSIDAPLSLPKGRIDIDKRDDNHFRECDLELRRRGIPFFPITLGPMRMLTKRGIDLKEKIRRISNKIKVIEVFPGATYDILRAKRKNSYSIRRIFRKAGFTIEKRKLTLDELDSIACALTARFFFDETYEVLGQEEEGLIYVPRSVQRPDKINL